MRQLLGVKRVARVGVVDDDLTIICADEGFPNWICAVGGVWCAASSGCRYKVPGLPSLSGSTGLAGP